MHGIDGCSIPTYGIPLQHLALAFARVGTGDGLGDGHARAARRLRQAVAKAPFMVGGTDRFDTRVMQRLGERVFCKVGAEGVYCAALPERGLGVALKVDDGNNARAAEVVMAALIEAYVSLDDGEAQLMRSPQRCVSEELERHRGRRAARQCSVAQRRGSEIDIGNLAIAVPGSRRARRPATSKARSQAPEASRQA